MSSFRRPVKILRCVGKPVLQSNGRFMPPEQQEITIMASVQPLKATEMDALPEGRRGCRAVKIYSNQELFMAEQKTGQQADRCYWLGRTYEVVGCDAFQSHVINHYRAYAVEVNDH